MSSIYGVGSSGSDIQTIFARLNANSAGATGSSTQSAHGRKNDQSETISSALKSLGLSDDQISDIQSKIKSALQNSDGSSDPKTTIDSILKDAGVDTDKFDAAMKANAPSGPPPFGGPGGSQGSGNPDSMLSSALKSKGFSDDQISSLQSKIQSALSSLGGGASRDSVRSTVNQTLSDNGVDLSSLFASFGNMSGQDNSMTGFLVNVAG